MIAERENVRTTGEKAGKPKAGSLRGTISGKEKYHMMDGGKQKHVTPPCFFVHSASRMPGISHFTFADDDVKVRAGRQDKTTWYCKGVVRMHAMAMAWYGRPFTQYWEVPRGWEPGIWW